MPDCRTTMPRMIQTDSKESTWKAFWQTIVEGRTAADVAADLGIGAVYTAKSRVLSHLPAELYGLF